MAHGKDIFPVYGELTLAKVRAGAVKAELPVPPIPPAVPPIDEVEIPARPPALCPGCPHRAFFYNLSRQKRKVMIAGDIGCYSMGVLPPFQAMDMLISMGASIGMAHGFRQAGGQEKAIATIGDSTFFHSGMAPLAGAVYNPPGPKKTKFQPPPPPPGGGFPRGGPPKFFPPFWGGEI